LEGIITWPSNFDIKKGLFGRVTANEVVGDQNKRSGAQTIQSQYQPTGDSSFSEESSEHLIKFDTNGKYSKKGVISLI